MKFVQMKMLIKVNPEKQSESELKSTWTSRFVQSLIRIFFFPVTIEGDKVCFSWLSWKTLVHFAFGIGLFASLAYLGLSSINFLDTLNANFSEVRIKSNYCKTRIKKSLIHIVKHRVKRET